MHGEDLTKGNMNRQLWNLSWPIMLSVFFHTLYNIVDAFWVGKLSPEAIAAVTISQLMLFAMVSLSMGITIGCGVLMAMSIGAKDKGHAEKIFGQSFVLSTIAAIIFTTISLVFRDKILIWSGATGSIYPLALEYFTVTGAGAVFIFWMMSVVFGFSAQGDNFTMTKIFAFSTLVNAVLDPIMIFGWFHFPAMGVSGAAIATVISEAIAVIIGVYILSGKDMMIRFKFSNLVFNLKDTKKVLDIGFPASLTQVLGPVGIAALTSIVSSVFHESGAISYSLVFRVEFFAFLPAIGFGVAAMAMLGQNIGAGNIERAKEVYKRALIYSFALATIFGIISALFSRQVIGIFTKDPAVMQYASSYLWLAPISFGFLAMVIVEASSFQGIGKSWPGFWITFLKYVIIAAPLSYLFASIMHRGIIAVWLSIAASSVIAAAAGYFWLKSSINRIKVQPVEQGV